MNKINSNGKGRKMKVSDYMGRHIHFVMRIEKWPQEQASDNSLNKKFLGVLQPQK